MINNSAAKQQGFFKDGDGRIVLWQLPNIPLIGWIIFKILSMVIAQEHLKAGLTLLSSAFLFTWAFLEITKGANYFRRLLGLLVLIATVAGFFR